MNSLVAIAILTIQKCLRSYLFQIVLFILFIGNVILIQSIDGDGTALGHFQILVSYTFSFTGYLLAFTAIWFGCFVVGDDIDQKQVHMILSKPISKIQFLLGKFSGICLLQFVLLVIFSIVFGITIFAKLDNKKYPDYEIQRLKKNVLTASKRFPSTVDKVSTSTNGEPGSMSKRLVEIPIHTMKTWHFKDLSFPEKGDTILLRYRMFLNSPNSDDQRPSQGIWWVNNPSDNKFYPIPLVVHTGKVQEISLPSEAISNTGELSIQYENRDQHAQSMLIPQINGPFLFISKSSFLDNYVRMVIMIYFKLIFSAIIGVAAGSLFSLPMAIFFATSYMIIGVIIVFIRSTFPETEATLNFISQAAYYIRTFAGYITIDLRQFYVIEQLMRGEFIEFSRIITVFAKTILFHGITIFLLGSYFFQKRELGK